jgi:tetratricopeptide (TPR) repeat protein
MHWCRKRPDTGSCHEQKSDASAKPVPANPTTPSPALKAAASVAEFVPGTLTLGASAIVSTAPAGKETAPVENGSMPPPSKVLQAKRPAALAVADPASTPSSQPPAPAEPEVFSGRFAGKVKLSRDLGKKYSLRVMKLLQHDQKYIEMEENRPELKSQIETFRRLLEEAAELDASKEPVTSKEPVKSEEPKASATPKPPTLVRPLSLWKLRFREKKKPRPVLKEGERQTYDINFILKFQGLCNEAASLAADWSQVVATYARTHADAHAQRQADMGRYEEALVEMQEALDLEIKFLGSEHSSLADSYRDIGKLHMLQGKYEEALEMFEKSLEIDTQVLGSNNHPDIVLTKEFMGQVWKEMGKTSEAQVGGPLTRIDAIEQKFTEAADIRRKELTMRRIEQDDLEQW